MNKFRYNMANFGTNSVVGTKCISNLNIQPIGGLHLAELDWEVKVFTSASSRSYVIKKESCMRVDDDNYYIPVDSSILGAGVYWGTVTLTIPDGNFADGIRIERLTVMLDITIDAQ